MIGDRPSPGKPLSSVGSVPVSSSSPTLEAGGAVAGGVGVAACRAATSTSPATASVRGVAGTGLWSEKAEGCHYHNRTTRATGGTFRWSPSLGRISSGDLDDKRRPRTRFRQT